jgi:excisionase family DNA binding protein
MHDLFTAEQVAAILQLSPKTIKDWLRAGKLPGYKIGRVWRVRQEDLEAFIQGARAWRGSEAAPSQDRTTRGTSARSPRPRPHARW